MEHMELRTYQIEGIARLIEILSARHSAYLGDEMGLGKSAMMAVVAQSLQVRKLAIVAPASLRLTLERELQKWSLEPWVIHVIKSRKDLRNIKWSTNLHTAVIISYELSPYLPIHLDGKVDMLVMDEVHYLMTPTTKRTKACLGRLWDMAEYKLCMSGTPLTSGVMNGFTVFNKLDPQNFKDRYSYGFKYTQAKRNWFTGQFEFKGGKNLGELRRKVSSFMVRRRKSDVLWELPPKVYSAIPLEVKGVKDYQLSPEHKALVAEGKSASLSTAYATARRGLGILKIPHAVEYIKEISAHKERLLVFAFHKEVIATISEMLSAMNITVLTITGDTSMVQRDRIVQKFQTPGGKIILVAQMQAAGVGLTLTAADTAIFAEIDWVPATVAQAIDRIHRIGTTADSVSIHYLVAANTMDEDIVAALDKKIKVISEALDGKVEHFC
jgi:SWI/SNF-related matrix-associated actin-dependent regulator 1 of chromatin subfamily A